MKTPQEMDRPTPEVPNPRRGNKLNSFLAGIATMLALLALGVGGFLFYKAMDLVEIKNPFNFPTRRNRSSVTPSPVTPVPISPSPEASIPVPPNPYVQPALANKGQIELISVKRIPGTPDEVSVEMRVNRVVNNVLASDTINIGGTTARNPVTNETYKSVEPLKRSAGTVSLFNMRQGQPVDAYVVLKVPQQVTLIDIFVENTGTFKNVLVADATSTGLPPIPPLPTAAPTPGSIPGATPQISPLGKTPPIQETIPIPGTTPPTLPAPRLATPTPKGSSQSSASPSAKESKTGQNTDTDPLVKKAYGNKAQVEILSVERVLNPETGKGDVVNVQMRVRRLADRVEPTNIINLPQTKARNPVSDNTYNAVSVAGNSNNPIALSNIPKGDSVNANVSLRVPEGVQMVDIYVPETGTFQQVQITRPSSVVGP